MTRAELPPLNASCCRASAPSPIAAVGLDARARHGRRRCARRVISTACRSSASASACNCWRRAALNIEIVARPRLDSPATSQRIHPDDPTLKIPHMGWNTLDVRRATRCWKASRPERDGLHAYFVHSFHLAADATPTTSSRRPTTAGRSPPWSAATIWSGTQFHPEKSQALGLALIANFLKWRP